MEMTALPIAGYFQTTRITISSKGLDFRYGLFWIFPARPMVAAHCRGLHWPRPLSMLSPGLEVEHGSGTDAGWPARRDGLQTGVKVHPLRTMDRMVPEQ